MTTIPMCAFRFVRRYRTVPLPHLGEGVGENRLFEVLQQLHEIGGKRVWQDVPTVYEGDPPDPQQEQANG